jgi:hypothetical protein
VAGSQHLLLEELDGVEQPAVGRTVVVGELGDGQWLPGRDGPLGGYVGVRRR